MSAPGPPHHPAVRALAALYAPFGGSCAVTYSFLGLCLLVTVPSLFVPELYGILGGIAPRRYWWQPLTASLEHGWPGFPGWAHLALNAFLILECGRPCERLLGSGRFLVLCLLAAGANAVVVSLTPGGNGSSLVIWSWGPPLFLAWLHGWRKGAPAAPAVQRLGFLLVLMYGVIVLLMGALPYLSGWRGNPLVGLLMGNLFHLVATAVGLLFTLGSARFIRRRLRALEVS